MSSALGEHSLDLINVLKVQLKSKVHCQAPWETA